MFKKPRFNNQQFNTETTPNDYRNERLMYEVKENRRRINNLAKRIIRLENYLRIKDTSDFSIIDDEDPQSPFYDFKSK